MNETDLQERLRAYIDLAMQWNKAIALFSRKLKEADLWSMAEESIQGGRLLAGRAGSLLDVGSGGGLPGIPMKLAFPHLTIRLCEPRRKKAQFLQEVIRECGLSGASVFNGRLEEMAPAPFFDACSVRGLRLEAFAGKLARMIRPAGCLLAFHRERDLWTDDDLGGLWAMVERTRIGVRGMAATLYERKDASGT